MCGNFFNPHSRSFLGGPIGQIGTSLIAAPFLGPEVGALTGLGGIGGGALVGAGLGGLEGIGNGNALQGALLGGLSGGLGAGGASYLTNASGLTTNGISDLLPSISGMENGLSNFADSSGLSQLFGGTAAPSGDLTAAYNDINSAAPNLEATAGATSPGNLASGGDYGAGGSPVSGASIGPGTIAPTAGGGAGSIGGGAAQSGVATGENVADTGSVLTGAQGNSLPWQNAGYINPSAPLDSNISDINPGTTNYNAGIGASPQIAMQNIFTGSNPATSGAAANYDLSGNLVGASANPASLQLSNAIGSAITPSGGNVANSGLTSLLGGSVNPLNGLINAGLGYLLNNPNTKGANQISNAATTANANYAPYLQAGTGAENQLSNLYGNNGTAAQTAAMNNFQTQLGYQFALNQGLNAVNANAAAMGNPLSGNNEEAINNYAQGTANQQYNNYVNQLQNLASGGMTAAGGIGSNLLTGAGAQAQTGQNKANAQNTAIGTGLNALFPTGGINLAQLLSGGNTGAGGSGLLGMLGITGNS